MIWIAGLSAALVVWTAQTLLKRWLVNRVTERLWTESVAERAERYSRSVVVSKEVEALHHHIVGLKRNQRMSDRVARLMPDAVFYTGAGEIDPHHYHEPCRAAYLNLEKSSMDYLFDNDDDAIWYQLRYL